MLYVPKSLSRFKPLILSVIFTLLVFLLIENLFISAPSDSVKEVVISIPEGKTAREIDLMLQSAGVLREGDSLLKAASLQQLEGFLFPDTYRFYASSTAEVVIERFFSNFKTKAEPLLMEDMDNYRENLILASLLEKEVSQYEDRRLIAGLLKKRLANDMPLQVDATLCYIKHYQNMGVDGYPQSCYPITKADKQVDSKYNTYLYKGLPPGPIANPGLEAIRAALSPIESPYWYYLSDPETNKTIFSCTLEEHNYNRRLYLSG